MDFEFKIWDKRENKWLEAGQELLGYVFYWKSESTIGYLTDRFILIRALGNKDKNGNMIYDGSIIRCDKRLFIVRWFKDAGGFFSCIRTDDENGYPNLNIGTLKGVEVIGHELENPEILKKGQLQFEINS
ncbi:YopX family protein [Clostridium algidicarnis]|uniref:YopX family protein n=1 Tax=Clostridium algidicarnis TaxID=37659 RepID=UPI001C0E2480|nr:YopX family protein [Clostridium algidicarnis]MBU3205155.1 YopX family protein [Clostridium algidicarnis]MBU3213308.1 YopX family protein [Clostridium algidicarnis]MBU3223797.1 YopX family protein [Clostridium algidicarnis]